MRRIREWLFDEWNEEHIGQHGVIPEEVEEVCWQRPYVSKTRQERIRVIGQRDSGRYKVVILALKGRGSCYPITTRDATQAERHLFNKQRPR
jgi:uncharacterized DUF497 family protein